MKKLLAPFLLAFLLASCKPAQEEAPPPPPPAEEPVTVTPIPEGEDPLLQHGLDEALEAIEALEELGVDALE